MKTLPARTFQNCLRLAFIDLPDSIRLIEENAFYCCSNLGTVTLPKSLYKIRKEAFYDCPSLKKVVYPYSLERFLGVTVEDGNNAIFAVLVGTEVE